MSKPIWWLTKDGDKTCLAMYEQHYSKREYRDGRVRKLFCGPGEKIVLRTSSGDALFVWRKFIDSCIDERTGLPQEGINCAIFRNESNIQASELVRQADRIADFCWPSERHYTTVNPKRVRSRNPGFCFIMAGWRRCGVTKGGLWVYEKLCNWPPFRVK
jgi:hypothetical protein